MSLKILALHGWGGSGDDEAADFEVRKFSRISSAASVALPSAPFAVDKSAFSQFLASLGAHPDIIEFMSEMPHHSWRDESVDANNQFSPDLLRFDVRAWTTSLTFLAAYIDKNGPFDGVCGFSQGGLLALLMIAASRSDGAFAGAFDFDFAIVGGVPAQTLNCDHVDDAPNADFIELRSGAPSDVPILRVNGANDPLLAEKRDAEYAQVDHFFSQCSAIEFDGAHSMPNAPRDWARISAWVAEQRATTRDTKANNE